MSTFMGEWGTTLRASRPNYPTSSSCRSEVSRSLHCIRRAIHRGTCAFFVDPEDGTPPSVFTGDTLFVGGCGNFNAGTPQMMTEAFLKLGSLPPDTLVWVGHEYTAANFQYCAFVEPSNALVVDKASWVQQQRSQGNATVPSLLAEELETNPFMRAAQAVPSVMAHTGAQEPWQAMKFVREEKSSGSWKSK
mmetsp:Transcript_70870/g.162514  ORF Transcript_70870/g.162514 Transcript_70870/m.162514 type:complete len:191 (+) Transcript_70870:271-843(+)